MMQWLGKVSSGMMLVLLMAGMLDAQVKDPFTRTQFRLLVPEDAFVFVAGEKMLSTGPERTFESPELERGKKYSYEIVIIFEGRVLTQTLTFEAGETIEIDVRPDFRKMSSVPLPERPFKPIRREWLPGRVWVI